MMLTRRTLIAAAGAAALPVRAASPVADAVTSTIVVEANRIWVPATIGGQGPFRFILDTGASVSGIATALAEKLGLRGLGHRRMGGVGGVLDFDFYEAKDVIYGGGIKQGSVAFAKFDRPIGGGAGLLAAGLVTTRDSDLDFVTQQWRVWPDGRPSFDGLTRIDGFIEPGGLGSDKLIVNAVLDGKDYRLLLDTGAPGELLLFPSAVRKSGLWNAERPFSPARLRGISGAEEKLGRVVRAGRLSLGDFAFDAPLVSLYDPKGFSGAKHDGLLGLPVIERLNLSTQVGRGRLWARANGRPKPREFYGRAGVWLEREGERIVVAVVSPASPASDAGLRVGNILRGNWATLLRQLNGPAGTEVTLDVDGASRLVKLRDYL